MALRKSSGQIHEDNADDLKTRSAQTVPKRLRPAGGGRSAQRVAPIERRLA